MNYLVGQGWGNTSNGTNVENNSPKFRVGILEKRGKNRLITPEEKQAHLSLVLRLDEADKV